MRTLVLIVMVVLLYACKGKSIEGVITPTEMNGINGKALYFIDKENTVITVVKPEYLRSADYDVKIERDTLVVGEKFVGLINVYKPNFKVRIMSPSEELITGSESNPNREYFFTPSNVGQFDFKGIIEYDTV